MHELKILKDRVVMGGAVVFYKEKGEYCFTCGERLRLVDKTSFLSNLIGKKSFLITDSHEELVGELKMQGLGTLSLDITYQGMRYMERVRLIKNLFNIQQAFQIGSVGYLLNKWRDKLTLHSMCVPSKVEILMGCLILYFSHQIGSTYTDPGE